MKTLTFITLTCLTLLSMAQENNQAELIVLVTDFENNSLEGEQILFVGKIKQKEFKGVSNSEGKFNIKLDGGDTYNIKIKSIGEAQEYNTIKIPAIEEG